MESGWAGQVAPSSGVGPQEEELNAVYALWGLSEQYLRCGKVLEAIKCLEAILQNAQDFKQQSFPLVELKTRLRAAELLLKFTENWDAAKFHLDRAQLLLQLVPSSAHYHVLILHHLAIVYRNKEANAHERQCHQKALEIAAGMGREGQDWYYYFGMEMAQSFLRERQFEKVIGCLSAAQQYAMNCANINAQRFFLLAEAQTFLFDMKIPKAKMMLTELDKLVSSSGEILSREQQLFTDESQRIASSHLNDALILYHLMLSSLYYLRLGDSKNAAKSVQQLLGALKKYDNNLKQGIQQGVRAVFKWMPAHLLYITFCHIMGVCNRPFDLASSYQNLAKGYSTIEEHLKKCLGPRVTREEGQLYNIHKSRLEDVHTLCKFKMIFLENIFYVHLAKSEPLAAFEQIKRAMETSSQFPDAVAEFAPCIHTMAGLLFFSIGEPVYAITHLQLALEHSPRYEHKVSSLLYLCLVYVQHGSTDKASSLLATHAPKIVANSLLPLPLRAAALFLQGLVLVKLNQLNDAKLKLKECIVLTKGMNNHQLSAQLYNLYGEIFLLENDTNEALGLLNYASNISSETAQDLLTKISSLRLLSNLHRQKNDVKSYEENAKMCSTTEAEYRNRVLAVTSMQDFGLLHLLIEGTASTIAKQSPTASLASPEPSRVAPPRLVTQLNTPAPFPTPIKQQLSQEAGQSPYQPPRTFVQQPKDHRQQQLQVQQQYGALPDQGRQTHFTQERQPSQQQPQPQQQQWHYQQPSQYEQKQVQKSQTNEPKQTQQKQKTPKRKPKVEQQPTPATAAHDRQQQRQHSQEQLQPQYQPQQRRLQQQSYPTPQQDLQAQQSSDMQRQELLQQQKQLELQRRFYEQQQEIQALGEQQKHQHKEKPPTKPSSSSPRTGRKKRSAQSFNSLHGAEMVGYQPQTLSPSQSQQQPQQQQQQPMLSQTYASPSPHYYSAPTSSQPSRPSPPPLTQPMGYSDPPRQAYFPQQPPPIDYEMQQSIELQQAAYLQHLQKQQQQQQQQGYQQPQQFYPPQQQQYSYGYGSQGSTPPQQQNYTPPQQQQYQQHPHSPHPPQDSAVSYSFSPSVYSLPPYQNT